MSGPYRRTRTLPALRKEFAIDCKLVVEGQGITEAEAAAFVKEAMRYASAAFLFKVPHPTGERDAHERPDNARCGGILDVHVGTHVG